MTKIYQHDLKLSQVIIGGQPIQRVTLALSSGGDIQLVDGKEKLAEQLIRAIVNDNVSAQGIALNSQSISSRQLNTLITLILRNFRQNQIYQTQESDPAFIGYNIYRFDNYMTSTDFVKASHDPITWTYTDLNLSNGFAYTYGIKYVYRDGVTESSMLEKLVVYPTQFVNNQNAVIGSRFVVLPGNESATIYVDFNRLFKAAELLESIDNISIDQDKNEPREYIVNINIKNLDGNAVSLGSNSFSIIKG